MIWLGVAIAFVGALGYALGAALQQYEAVGEGVNLRLVRRPRWLIGGAIGLTGACLHAVALSFAPLVVIQPVSVTTLLFAVPLAAMMYGRRPCRAEIGGAAAVTAGLALLMTFLPEHDVVPVLSNTGALGLLLTIAVIAGVGQLVVRWAPRPGGKALFLGATAGMVTATVSFFVRVVGANTRNDPAFLLHWFTLMVPAVLIVAAVLLQRSYAIGVFGIAYASAQVIDPITSITAGIVLLGEPLPSTHAGNILPAMIAAVLLIAGTFTLARLTPDRHPRHLTPQPQPAPA